jgi:catechol 2,3-dioxygenase-like lactoylglutathione lyase family enzyme
VLTVVDVRRSVDFYTRLLGFQVVMELGSRVLLTNGAFILALTPPPDPVEAIPGDCFNENRIGLDHLSLVTNSREELEVAQRLFASQGIPYGEIKDLGPDLGLFVLAFRDPDNIQIELCAAYTEQGQRNGDLHETLSVNP